MWLGVLQHSARFNPSGCSSLSERQIQLGYLLLGCAVPWVLSFLVCWRIARLGIGTCILHRRLLGYPRTSFLAAIDMISEMLMIFVHLCIFYNPVFEWKDVLDVPKSKKADRHYGFIALSSNSTSSLGSWNSAVRSLVIAKSLQIEGISTALDRCIVDIRAS